MKISLVLFLFKLSISFLKNIQSILENILSNSIMDYSYRLLNYTQEKNHLNIQLGLNGENKTYTLQINCLTDEIIQFKLTPNSVKLFELPKENPFVHNKNITRELIISKLKYKISMQKNPFTFSIKRQKTNETIFKTEEKNPFRFMIDFTELKIKIPSKNIYGIGQRTSTFNLHSGTYTLYNKDNPNKIDYGIGKNNNRYGSHPIYLMREKSGYYHINYLRNSFGMDIELDLENNKLKYLILGGVLDFTLFLGNKKPENVIKMYHKFLGGWMMPPFWSLGFHQSRWGYNDIDSIESMLGKYEKEKIPLDTFWLDLDYMNNNHPCTWDEKRFPSELFKQILHIYNKRYVLISEPCIGLENKKVMNIGIKYNTFISENNTPVIIRMWPGKSYCLDFFHPNASLFQEKCHDFLYNKSRYSGIWIDMNEISTFSSGKIDSNENELPCNETNYYYYPGGYKIQHKTFCPNTLHFNNLTHSQIHNVISLKESEQVKLYLKKKFPNEFPFLLTRANAPKIGKYSFIWSGDNGANYTFYKYSLSEIFNFNLFGIPMSGTDVCGFMGETNEKLCAKWYQIGSLFPFFRAHRHLEYNDTEPFSMGKILLETSKNSIIFRYKILKYYYSIFIRKKKIGTIFKPLFFEFGNDEHLIEENIVNSQFMIGKDLLCIPNFNYYDSDFIIGYFPKGENWFNLRNYEFVKKNGFNKVETLFNVHPEVFLRSGRSIFVNDDISNVLNSKELDNNFSLIIAFKHLFGYFYKSIGFIPDIDDYNNKFSVKFTMKKFLFYKIESFFDYMNMQIKIIFNELKYCTYFTKGIFIKKLNFFFPLQIKEKMDKKYYLELNLQQPIKLFCDKNITYNINVLQYIN
jgi:alpha-glucosidase/lysosomal alpha-glucosidase